MSETEYSAVIRQYQAQADATAKDIAAIRAEVSLLASAIAGMKGHEDAQNVPKLWDRVDEQTKQIASMQGEIGAIKWFVASLLLPIAALIVAVVKMVH